MAKAAGAAWAAPRKISRQNPSYNAAINPVTAPSAGRPPQGFKPEATNDDDAVGADRLAGVRALIVEDEFLVAIQLEETLHALGCAVLEPAHSVEEAMEAVEAGDFDIAVLDINLGGQPVYPVALRLRDNGVPFVFTTGYSRQYIDEEWRDVPTLRKPYMAVDLRRAIEQALQSDRT